MYIRRVSYTSIARTERERGKEDARRQAGSRRDGTPDSRERRMRLDHRDELGPRARAAREPDPAVELRGAQRDIVDVGDSDGA